MLIHVVLLLPSSFNTWAEYCLIVKLKTSWHKGRGAVDDLFSSVVLNYSFGCFMPDWNLVNT